MDYETIEFYNLTQDTPMGDEAWPVLTAGGSASDPMPFQTSPLVKFLTSIARSQGRKYLPPITEAFYEGSGFISSAALTAIAAYAAELLTDRVVSGSTLKMGNYNIPLDRFAAWAGAVIDDILKTQRRRVQGVGS
jgi:hypothetical protein